MSSRDVSTRQPRVAAFIPARGGSKGIPRKNVRPFLGQPLVVHSIAAAQAAQAVTSVVVSTDDAEIAAVASAAGATVLHRPAELAGDEATTESAIAHFLRVCAEPPADAPCPLPELLVLLQPTSPLRPAGAVEEAVARLLAGGFDSLLSISPTHRFFWRLEADGGSRAEYDFLQRPRRQDLRPEQIRYVETGSIYVFTRTHFERIGNRLGGRIGHVIHSEPFALEIDTPADWAALEAIARQLADE
jgi:N-acylneuraminate cytidylyltransferase